MKMGKLVKINHLEERIIATVDPVTPIILANIWQEVEYRLDVCRARNGSHVKTYLIVKRKLENSLFNFIMVGVVYY